ncbi:MAG: hypothetical protein HQM12_11265 [SAR324 cluster bacterium]|nr:hypothetical protein [SAR324 cluster bacterium]MBF0350778.1 hypothetical protein [SAR324 cluster bacterium]
MTETNPVSYEQFKKKRPKWTLRFRRNIEFAFFCFFEKIGNTYSLKTLQKAGKIIGLLAFILLKKDRGIAEKQLSLVFPELSSEQIRQCTKDCFMHFGQGMLEFFAIEQLIHKVDQYIHVDNPEVLDQAYAEQQGVVLLAMHMGNWELIVPYLIQKGYPAKAATTNYPDERINTKLQQSRGRQNIQLIPRGADNTIKSILECFKNKEIFLVAIDQDTNVPSMFIPFFGRPAQTPISVSSLALRYGSVIVSYTILRQPDGTFHLHFERYGRIPVIRSPQKSNIYQLTYKLNQHMESLIKKNPSQWAWFHRRWRHHPKPEDLEFIAEMEHEISQTI